MIGFLFRLLLVWAGAEEDVDEADGDEEDGANDIDDEDEEAGDMDDKDDDPFDVEGCPGGAMLPSLTLSESVSDPESSKPTCGATIKPRTTRNRSNASFPVNL